MSILSGYKKYKRYILTDSGYQLLSQWTSSNTVHFDDGYTAQTKVGAISGITDSLTSTSSNVALSAKSGKSLQDQVTKLNTDLDRKAASSHTHKKSEITDFPSSLPASDVYSWAKASSKPSYSWNEITNKPSTFSPSSHSHSWNSITEKPSTFTPSSHNHSDLYYDKNTINGQFVSTTDDSNWARISGFAKYRDSNNANVTASGLSYLISLISVSDERIKENIKSTNIHGLDIINSINHKSYDFKNQELFGDHVDIGYIAQEIVKLVPEAVMKVPQNKDVAGYDYLYQLNYVALIPYLTKAIQELSEKVDALSLKEH